MDQVSLLKKQPLVWGRLRLKGAKDRVQSKDSSPLNPLWKPMKTSFSINQMLDAPGCWQPSWWSLVTKPQLTVKVEMILLPWRQRLDYLMLSRSTNIQEAYTNTTKETKNCDKQNVIHKTTNTLFSSLFRFQDFCISKTFGKKNHPPFCQVPAACFVGRNHRQRRFVPPELDLLNPWFQWSLHPRACCSSKTCQRWSRFECCCNCSVLGAAPNASPLAK